MIFGVGTDIVSVQRIAAALNRHGDRFFERVLAETERTHCPLENPARHRFVARRWAVKEAFAKAFGTGIGKEVGLNDVWIEHNASGRPELRYASQLAKNLADRRLNAHISISDEQDYAVAFVVIEQESIV